MRSNADRISDFVADHRNRAYPPDVIDAAKQCLVDWFGVVLGAKDEPAARYVHAAMMSWRSQGDARILLGGTAAPAVAALVNATMSHCLDYDDTHIESILHGSGPTWAATLAVGTARNSSERELLSAFITGFEVGARIGNGGTGVRLNHSGWHSTCTLGRYSSAVAAAVLQNLDARQVKHMLGIVATQVGGLTASIGTMAKPFQVGKAAADGVLSAELAAEGMDGASDLLDSNHGLFQTLFQDGGVCITVGDFADGWEITRNSFKPYAACQLAHASIDSARRLSPIVGDAEIANVRAFVNPLAIKLAGNVDPTTPNEGKFSLAYTISLGLHGRRVTNTDFSDASLRDPRIVALAARVETLARDDVGRTEARVEVTLADGRKLVDHTPLAYGSVGNGMQWSDLEAKFMSMAEPALGSHAQELLSVLRNFETSGSLAKAFQIVDAGMDSRAPGGSGVFQQNAGRPAGERRRSDAHRDSSRR